MSLSLSDLGNIMDPTGKTCPTGRDLVVYILPIITLQYIMGVLVQLKHTALFRIALLPVILWVVPRAHLALDLSCGQLDQVPKNAAFSLYMTSVVTYTLIWTLARRPYKRDNVAAEASTSIPMACWNAWDLLVNLRGTGWNWLLGPIPRQSGESWSRPLFLLFAIARAIFCLLAFDMFTEAQFFDYQPRHINTIFDHSLAPIPRWIRALHLVYVSIWKAYFITEGVYQLNSAIFVTLFWQHPSQWPPLFDRPWASTSLSDLWGRRWHQMVRHVGVTLGGQPLTYFLGRPGYVLGTFLVSGIIHCIEFRANGRGGYAIVEGGFYVMNAVGVLLERTWSKVAGRHVCGIYGWIWTLVWVTIWAVPMVDGWSKVGRFNTDIFAGSRPATSLLSLVLSDSVDRGFAANCVSLGISVPFLVYTLFTLS